MFSKQLSFHKLFLASTLFIIFGITLGFSTATRSVFEVNKLGITKIGICILIIMYSYDILFKQSARFTSFKQNIWFNVTIILYGSATFVYYFYKPVIKHLVVMIGGKA